jgi:hypothetical protein
MKALNKFNACLHWRSFLERNFGDRDTQLTTNLPYLPWPLWGGGGGDTNRIVSVSRRLRQVRLWLNYGHFLQ